jgi:hypothetical protein
MTRATLILRAYIELIAHDLFMFRHNFESLHQRIRNFPVRHVGSNTSTREDVTLALNVACCFYPKRVLCLQRSAVFVRMLRAKGITASMVIGAQKVPFMAHAWVEVGGDIINDRQASRERFLVLEVC